MPSPPEAFEVGTRYRVFAASAWFLGGVLFTVIGIFLISLYEPVLRVSPSHAPLTIVAYAHTRTVGANVTKTFSVRDPEILNVGLKSGSISKCTIKAFGTHGQPEVEVTQFNKQLIRPFEALPAKIHFRATFTPVTGSNVGSWNVECYDNLGQYAFKLHVPAANK